MVFQFEKMTIPDVIIIKPQILNDERGYFFEEYQQAEFAKNGVRDNFVQDNRSFSKKNVLRGLHFQREPMAQAKLLRVSKGRIFDVAVDIRKNSESYGKHISVVLSEENKYILYIPKGFAHGFLAIEDSELLYKTSNFYSREHDSSILWNDPKLDINWPIKDPITSKKDREAPKLESLTNI